MKKDVFVSYSRKDTHILKFLEAELANRKINSFIDKRNIKLGKDYAEEIAEAIKECKIMLFIWSENSNISEHATSEISIAFNLKKPIVALKIGRFEPSGTLIYRLSKNNYLEIDNFNQNAISEICDQITDFLKDKGLQPKIKSPDETIPHSINKAETLCSDGRELIENQEYERAVEMLITPAINDNEEAQELLCQIFRDKLRCTEFTETTYSQFLPEAEKGKAYAQFIIAKMYQQDFEDKESNSSESFKWAMRAAEQQLKYAEFLVGRHYERGEGVETNYKLALDWYLKAAEKGDSFAMVNMAIMYERGKGVRKDINKAIEWYQRGTQLNDGVCWGNLGILYLNENEKEKGLEYIHKAIDAGELWYLAYLGNLYEFGWFDIDIDRAKALECLELAAEKGELSAKYRISCYYWQNNEPDIAFAWAYKAAILKDPDSECQLGYFYQNGIGCEENTTLAWEWFMKAAKHKNIYAMYQLGSMCEDGIAPEGHDPKEAVQWYRMAAEQKLSEAQKKMSELYSEGKLVEKDDTELLHWVKVIAENGDVDAQRRLGRMYLDGVGASSEKQKILNESKGILWYKKAAEANDLKAQLELAGLYEKGIPGIICRNQDKAFEWYKLAAKNGSGEGQYKSGVYLYEKENYDEAEPYLKDAIENGYIEAKQQLHSIFKNRQKLNETTRKEEDVFLASNDDNEDIYEKIFPLDYGDERDSAEIIENKLKEFYAPLISYKECSQTSVSTGENEDNETEQMIIPAYVLDMYNAWVSLENTIKNIAQNINVKPFDFNIVEIDQLFPIYTLDIGKKIRLDIINSWFFLKRYFRYKLYNTYFYDHEQILDIAEKETDEELQMALINIVEINISIETIIPEMYGLYLSIEKAEYSQTNTDYRAVYTKILDNKNLPHSYLIIKQWIEKITKPNEEEIGLLEKCRKACENIPHLMMNEGTEHLTSVTEDDEFEQLLNEFIDQKTENN